jgi:hypothetical protein
MKLLLHLLRGPNGKTIPQQLSERPPALFKAIIWKLMLRVAVMVEKTKSTGGQRLRLHEVSVY